MTAAICRWILHLGARAEHARTVVADPANDDGAALFEAIKNSPRFEQLADLQRLGAPYRGVFEKTTIGVERLFQMLREEGRSALPGCRCR